MPYGIAIALIVAGLLVALFLNTTIGVILLVVGVIGLLVPYFGGWGDRRTSVR